MLIFQKESCFVLDNGLLYGTFHTNCPTSKWHRPPAGRLIARQGTPLSRSRHRSSIDRPIAGHALAPSL